MKAMWINLRKRLRTPSVSAALSALVDRVEPDLILVQEACRGEPPGALGRLGRAGGCQDLAIYADPRLPLREIVAFDPAMIEIATPKGRVINLHLSPYSSAARRRQLQVLQNRLAHETPTLVGGDFNLAPRPADGLYDGRPSAFTKGAERRAFEGLLAMRGLSDVLASGDGDFTIERRVRGGLVQFRCDLLLCPTQLRDRVQAAYLHETRGAAGFTDHSAILVSWA